MPVDTKVAFSEDEIRERIASVPYWFHRIEIAPGIVTPGEDDSPGKIHRLGIPKDLLGKRVLDIGAYDGFFSFECERRGAEVVAIDTIPYGQSGFKVAHELLGSKVRFRSASVYDLNPESFGQFDLVLCLGVIYHLRHPLLGLEHIHSICKGTLILETQICDEYFIDARGKIASLHAVAPSVNKTAIAQFYPGAELNGDPSNWWSPNLAALEAMLGSTGFKPRQTIQNGVRACVHCDRVDLTITGPETEYFPGRSRNPAVERTPPPDNGIRHGAVPHVPTSSPSILDRISKLWQRSGSLAVENTLSRDVQTHTTTTSEPAVLDTLSTDERDEQVQAYDDSFREAIAEGGSIYSGTAPMPPMIQAGHERRMELLDSLPIGDVSDKVCVDYGVGSWGFACIYPRLQACGRAIGIDISYEAIKESAAISANGNFPYGDNYTYLTSRGDNIKLDDHSVDIFFTGECIEHVENTAAFLDEIHRVLKPGGLLILTTPNADAFMFSINNERYAVGPEHVALMSYSELRSYLDQRFAVLTAHGFNGSLHHSLDNQINDLSFAKHWAARYANQPELATGLVVLARRRDDYHSSRYQQHYYHHNASEMRYEGDWKTVPLHKTMTGRLSSDGEDAAITLDFEGSGIILNFWCHPWSGQARVAVDGVEQLVNLYSSQGGFNRIVIEGLVPGTHQLQIRGAQDRDPRSQGNEVIFYQAISYQHFERAVDEQ
jgi:2-polyprenyl-3-methyl-5-hydroxy-6-metoxy-1,4-benzoquinol methylase